MKRYDRIISALTLLVILSLSLLGRAGINALDSLETLVRKADLIVVGRVVKLTQIRTATVEPPGQRPFTERRIVAAVEVRRTLKGEDAGGRVNFEFDTADVPSLRYTHLKEKQYGIIFLVRGKAGYEIPRGTNGIVIASPSSPLPQGTPLEKVVTEVAYVLLSDTTSEGEKGLAFIMLQGTKTPQVQAVFRMVSKSNSMLRYSAMSMLLSFWNDLSVLPEAVDILMSDREGVTTEHRKELAMSIPYSITDPKAIPLLLRLAGSADPFSRGSALEALGQINDPRVLDPLTRGLDDKDQRVRYHAVRGLAKVTGDEIWFGGWESYIKEEKRLLEYWRNWAQTRRGT